MRSVRILSAAVLLAAGSGAAAAGEPGPYVGAALLGAYSEMSRVRTRGLAAPFVENDSDWVVGGALRLGYGWRELPIRTEIEVAHRYRFDLDVRDGSAVDYETNVGTTTVSLNLLVEFRNASPVTPWFGASVGWAHNRVETDRTDLVMRDRQSRDGSDDDLAWGLMLGADWRFAERWTAEAGYRLVHLGGVDVGPFAGGEGYRAADQLSHDLLLGLRYRFR